MRRSFLFKCWLKFFWCFLCSFINLVIFDAASQMLLLSMEIFFAFVKLTSMKYIHYCCSSRCTQKFLIYLWEFNFHSQRIECGMRHWVLCVTNICPKGNLGCFVVIAKKWRSAFSVFFLVELLNFKYKITVNLFFSFMKKNWKEYSKSLNILK